MGLVHWNRLRSSLLQEFLYWAWSPHLNGTSSDMKILVNGTWDVDGCLRLWFVPVCHVAALQCHSYYFYTAGNADLFPFPGFCVNSLDYWNYMVRLLSFCHTQSCVVDHNYITFTQSDAACIWHCWVYMPPSLSIAADKARHNVSFLCKARFLLTIIF